MSILVVQLVPEGLLFGADRNITSQLKLSDGSVEIVVSGQSERPKVLKWPNREVIVGYVGAAASRVIHFLSDRQGGGMKGHFLAQQIARNGGSPPARGPARAELLEAIARAPA